MPWPGRPLTREARPQPFIYTFNSKALLYGFGKVRPALSLAWLQCPGAPVTMKLICKTGYEN